MDSKVKRANSRKLDKKIKEIYKDIPQSLPVYRISRGRPRGSFHND